MYHTGIVYIKLEQISYMKRALLVRYNLTASAAPLLNRTLATDDSNIHCLNVDKSRRCQHTEQCILLSTATSHPFNIKICCSASGLMYMTRS